MLPSSTLLIKDFVEACALSDTPVIGFFFNFNFDLKFNSIKNQKSIFENILLKKGKKHKLKFQ